jgi:signal recognition particle receptor subunit beta
MPVFQHANKQLHLKVVYYGPGMGGKTTNLKYLHAHSRPEMRGKLISLATESERTLFFDLLPVDLGMYRGYSVRLHLCTVPGQIAMDATRKMILQNVDGVVFVVDSQELALDSNIESMRNLELNLALQGDDPATKPLVVQYNKRDLPGALSVDELHAQLQIPDGTAETEAIACHGWGVGDTLKASVKKCLMAIGDPAARPEGRSQSILPGIHSSMFPGGRPPALDERIPAPARVPGSLRHRPPTTREAYRALAAPASSRMRKAQGA